MDLLMVRLCVVDASRDSLGTFLSSIGVLGTIWGSLYFETCGITLKCLFRT